MSEEKVLTGLPSVDRPWMKFYPPFLMNMIKLEETTLREYLTNHAKSLDRVCLEIYGKEYTFEQLFAEADRAAASLKAMGFKKRDQIPCFFQSVPEFMALLLAAEKIGASLVMRDNTLAENIECVSKTGSHVMFAHSYLSQKDMNQYIYSADIKMVVLLDPLRNTDTKNVPDYCLKNLDTMYKGRPASGPMTITWDEFLALGDAYTDVVEASININRPLFRCYTSGSTGPSKQVIHSAYNMISILCQMNFWASGSDVRPVWMLASLPPALIATVVCMMLLPMASDNLTRLSPYCDPEDLDLEMMRIRPNGWAMIPMFDEIIMRSKRIPADYDISHLTSPGAGSEPLNNNQLKRFMKYLIDHNADPMKANRLTCGYGCSEAGSNVTMPMSPHPYGNGFVNVPLPYSRVGIFKPGTYEELGYNQPGEICKTGPGVMLGYDDPEVTAKTLIRHPDGDLWLHIGDIGYMDENGHLFIMTRGESPRFGGGDLAVQPIENKIADQEIEGIDDEFVVVVPDIDHNGYYLPYLYVVLKPGYTVDDIREKVNACLDEYQRPVEIITIDKRPFFHFKTDRIGLKKQILKRLHAEKDR